MMLERIVCSFRDCSVSNLFNNSCIKANDLDYHRQVPYCAYMVVGSVNGLICRVSRVKELILWNPSIRKYKKLPSPKTKTTWGYRMYSFGYDEFHDDYKSGRFVNGKLHWITIIDWLMKEYGVKESWMKMFTLKIPQDPSVCGYLGKIRLHMASGSEILVVLGSTFMIYNLKGEIYKLRSSKATNSNNWDEAEIYIESLVCPFSTVGTEDATKMGLKSLGCETMK
uniref:F-Box protein n=1 Tax=Solanum tuberosum TaxID=4113 RepID=M0ZWX8_SOLTU